jgi:hypothetical protein
VTAKYAGNFTKGSQTACACARLDRIKEWFPSSRKPATVHRTVAFKLFEPGHFIGTKKERPEGPSFMSS